MNQQSTAKINLVEQCPWCSSENIGRPLRASYDSSTISWECGNCNRQFTFPRYTTNVIPVTIDCSK